MRTGVFRILPECASHDIGIDDDEDEYRDRHLSSSFVL
jgi:hypothetical protein